MNKFAHALFCDDIRFEVSNKVSYIGTYANELMVQAFPVQLPKFCISASAGFSPDEPINSLCYKVYLDDALISEAELPQAELANGVQVLVKELGTADDPLQVITFTANIVLSPLPIEKPSKISVYAEINGERFIAGKLRVKQAAC